MRRECGTPRHVRREDGGGCFKLCVTWYLVYAHLHWSFVYGNAARKWIGGSAVSLENRLS